MASSSSQSLSWHRVLPAPPALLNGHASHELPRRNSSLLQHHLFTSRDLLDHSKERRSTVPTISYHPHAPQPAQSIPLFRFAPISDSPQDPQPTRKRSSSLMAAGSEARATSPATQGSENPARFCLCQPDPKIPRPRNAFILYRQHHQAAVVAKHPGLPNPEISKIIGEEWRALPTKVKNQWKALAEEEKLRHQQQYPDYRYQPRRLGRNGNPTNLSNTTQVGPSGRCLRCGGNTMNPPMTPRTPGFPAATPNQPRSPPPADAQPIRRHPSEVSHRQAPYSPPRTGSAITRVRPFGDVFPMRSPITEAEYRARFGQHPTSPDPKRRRYNGPGVIVPPRGDLQPSPATGYPRPMNYSPQRQFVPRLSQEQPMHPMPPRAMTGPEPRLVYQSPRYPSGDVIRRDSIASAQPPTSGGQPPSTSPQKAVSAESQIMSIPAIQKLRILSKAAPPLPAPAPRQPNSPTQSTSSRGAILAIEGSEEDVQLMTSWLQDFLAQDLSGFNVHTFSGPDVNRVMAETEAVETQQERYLEAIRDWHKVSKEVIRFVSPNSAKKDSNASSETTNPAEAMDIDPPSASPSLSPSEISPRTITRTVRSLQLIQPPTPSATAGPVNTTGKYNLQPPQSQSSPSPTQTKFPSNSPVPTKIPIALLPRYQLSTVDTASLAMHITDAYAPIDHWQWAAALWRGCVGADVTIVVTEEGKDDGGNAGVGGGVEVRLGAGDVKAVIAKKGSGNGGTLEGGALRRVGFEIVEFLRR